MSKKKGEQYLLLLQRSQLSIFRKSTGKIGTWKFDPKIVNQLEIKDIDVFSKTFEAFLKQMELHPGEVTLVLDKSVYFTHELATKSDEKIKNDKLTNITANDEAQTQLSDQQQREADKEEQRKFVQSVPFANIYSNIIELHKQRFVIVVNRDFYEPIIRKLTELRYRVNHIFPLTVVSELFNQKGYTPEAAGLMLHSIDKFKSSDLLKTPIISNPNALEGEDDILISPPASGSITTEMPEEKGRLFLMIAAFVILLLILAGVFIWSRQRDEKLNQQAAQQNQQQAASANSESVVSPSILNETVVNPSASQSAQVDLSTFLSSSESAQLKYPDLLVEIENGAGNKQAAEDLREVLEQAGFNSVDVGQTMSTTSGAVIVRVSEGVPVELQQLLLDSVQDLGYQATIREVDDSDIDISILLTTK